ncbi:MEDS domain-containing protein [Halorientalis brevis]|uniref:histidine kinase n=1 Tax=Halorientalis brevis TaxID=1126241 RepID=A0ABD6C849_9EURY|nr:MEDS domain-containing protein [Halorientalis brevis]
MGRTLEDHATFLRQQTQVELLDAIEEVAVHDHLALIYENRQEQFDAALPFIEAGLENDEKCIYIADDNLVEDVTSEFEARGMAVERALDSGAFEVAVPADTYLRDGYFDPDEMLAFLETETEAALAEGFDALRVTGEMTWQLGGDPGTERLMEYEAKLTPFLDEHACLAICQYNRTRFSDEVLRGVVETHPQLIYRYTLCENPHFVPPEEFLATEHTWSLDRVLDSLVEGQRLRNRLRDREVQLQVLNRALRHNLRNNVNVVLSTLEFLERDLGDEYAEELARIRDHGESLVRMSEQARQASTILERAESFQTADLTPILTRQLERVERQVSDAAVTAELPDRAPVLAVDGIELAFEELLDNAIRHNDSDAPRVRVDASCTPNGAVNVRIADNGPGIPADDAEVLTGDRDIDQLFHGSGFGLWLVNWLVDRSRGTLAFEENEPRGSVVEVRLPHARDADAPDGPLH